jgi:gamma-glutamylaminecyclotransferase
MAHRIFVYGTLLNGEKNAAQIEGATFVGAARTPPSFTLLDLGEHPAMLEDGVDAVHGEVYEVSDALLAHLDAFEEHPDVYRRSTIQLADGSEAFTYMPRERPPGTRMPGGDWRGRVRPAAIRPDR